MRKVFSRLRIRSSFRFGVALGALTLAAPLEAAVYSLEAVAVHSFPIPGGPVNRITIAPGDSLTVKIFLRDWSVNGERLRSYQAEIDKDSYSSGDSGTVQPVGFLVERAAGEDSEYAYIDRKDPQYVHAGLGGITIADVHNASGYRWLNVLVDLDTGPISPQDGTKYYCGTVHLEASRDAKGVFTIQFVEGPENTGIRDPNNDSLLPVSVEPLVVEVRPGWTRLMIASTVPPDGAVDAREPILSSRVRAGDIKPFEITFTGNAAGVSAGDFSIEDGTNKPPKIQGLTAEASRVRFSLDRDLRVGRWTTITYRPTGSAFKLGRLPGDVNNDGVSDSRDILALVETLNKQITLPLYRSDIDRDGKVGPEDVLRVIELISPQFSRAAPARRIVD